MKKARERIFLYFKIMLVIATAFVCLTKPEITGVAVAEALNRCLGVIIPSLYAMMIVSPLLIKSGVVSLVSDFFGNTGKILFGMEKCVFSIFLFSMLAGYPVGEKMLLTAYEKGLITKKRAELFGGVCYGAGSAFVFGCISGRLFNTSAVGRIIIVSTVSANIILAFVISFFTRKECNSRENRSYTGITADMLTECVTEGGYSVMNICFMIMAFATVTKILDYSGIISAVGSVVSYITRLSADDSAQLFRAFLDVTAVDGFTYGNFTLLPYLSALVSFGGVCVIFQISAVVSGKLSLKPLIVTRSISAVISFIICKAVTPLMLSEETILTASMNVRTHKADSPVPSVMLLIMTVMLFCHSGKIKREV